MVKIRCMTLTCLWLNSFVVLLGVQCSEESVWKQNTRWRQMQVKEQSVGTSLSFQLHLITSSQLHCLCPQNDAPYSVPVNSHILWTADQVTPCFPFPQINSSLSFMFDVVSIKFCSSTLTSPKWHLIFRSAIWGVGGVHFWAKILLWCIFYPEEPRSWGNYRTRVFQRKWCWSCAEL